MSEIHYDDLIDALTLPFSPLKTILEQAESSNKPEWAMAGSMVLQGALRRLHEISAAVEKELKARVHIGVKVSGPLLGPIEEVVIETEGWEAD